MMSDVADDPTYNPFTEHDYGYDRPTTSQGFYRSAFIPSLTDAPQISPSPLQEEQTSERGRGRKGHLRARSEIQLVPPNSAGLHPLKSALFALSVDDSLSDVTRPNLFRIVSEGQASPSREEELSSNETDMVIEEKDVILHHVTQKDSLAGVALKYGITLANLRRANQLWTSDSIHRRSVLYIPIEVASRAQEYLRETKLDPDAAEEVTNVFNNGAHSSPLSFDENKSDVDGLTTPSINVIRVPANQLTYFPPSSTKNLESRPNRHSLDNPSPTLTSGPRISPTSSNKYDPTLPNKSFTSILTALPIAASTRDEIITRLSFDSVSSSYSDTSRASPSEENSHELGEVRRLNRGRTNKLMVSLSNEGDADDTSMPTPKARPVNDSLPPSPTTATRQLPYPPPSSLPKSSHIRSVSSCSPPRFYVSQLHETFVRTSQPEPSPAMEIPIRRSSTLSAISGKKLQATFGVERQSGVSKDRKGVKDIDLHSLVRRMRIQDPQP